MPKEITYPYIEAGWVIHYVGARSKYMRMAKEFARSHALDKTMPGAAVVVKNGKVIGIGANGSDHHAKHGCRRVELGCKTGEGYELCEGCHPKNHSEASALTNALAHHQDTRGARLYLWGHWWVCRSCWKRIVEAGITKVILQENSEVLFNKEHPDNIVGRQFED